MDLLKRLWKTNNELTGIQQVCIVVSKVLARNEVLSVPVQGQERHHVVFTVVPYRGIGCWVIWRRRSVPPEPLLIDAVAQVWRHALLLVVRPTSEFQADVLPFWPVNKGVMEEENGVVGRALYRRHGSVHENVDGGVHAHACAVS